MTPLPLWDRFGSDVGEAAFLASLGMIERACASAQEAKWGRFAHHPRGELRRLRHDLARALMLARFAVEMQTAVNEEMEELNRPARELANQQAAARRRAQTLPAELARLANARARKETAAASSDAAATVPSASA